MKSPLQMLRALFPFSSGGAERKRAAAMRGWLDTVTGHPPEKTIAQLSSGLLPWIAGQSSLSKRFKLLEEIRAEAEAALPTPEKLIAQAALPLPHKVATAALHADNLLKGLALAYLNIVHSILNGPPSQGLNPLLHHSAQRAMAMIARRQQLAYRAYTAPSASSWQTLHALYQTVRNPQTRPLNGQTAPIEHEYLVALLFAYLDPDKLPRTELDTWHACIRQLAPYAQLSQVKTTAPGDSHANSECCFIVHPGQGHPGYPLARQPADRAAAGGLLIDCKPIIAALDRKLTERPAKPGHPPLSASPALLQGLRQALSGKRTRRYRRTGFHPHGELVSGLAAVLDFLAGNNRSRRAADQDERPLTASEWAMIDESPDGFLLRHIKGRQQPLAAGDIVALQPRESCQIHLCLVRRIALSATRLEIGLQLMSPQVSVVDIVADELPARPAIFLHSLPAYGRLAGLIATPGSYRTGQPIVLKLSGNSWPRQIGACMEANEGLEFFALDPPNN